MLTFVFVQDEMIFYFYTTFRVIIIIIIIIITTTTTTITTNTTTSTTTIPWEFFTSSNTDGLSLAFEWQQVSRTLLSILIDLNNAIIWMISTCPFISESSSPFINPLVTVPRAPITIGINVTFMFHSFFFSLARLRYLSFFSLSFNFTLWSATRAQQYFSDTLKKVLHGGH